MNTRPIIAGITVGIIAIPLAMALAIARGVPPQYGLYTSAIAGIVIAVTGGSRYSVSGPTTYSHRDRSVIRMTIDHDFA